jgi:hypothetical protein
MLIGGGNGAAPMPAKDSCEILDLGAKKLQWKSAASMKHRRVMPDAVLLPDGTVLVVNGSSTGESHGGTPVYAAEVYDSKADTWTTLAEMTMDRLYHATAILLPDARVLTAGTDREWNAGPVYDYAHTQLEVFSPPYLFHGPRPTIRLAPQSVTYDTAFEVATDDADTIKSAVLIRNGSCTHSFNSDQRFVELEIKKRIAPKQWSRTVKMELPGLSTMFTKFEPVDIGFTLSFESEGLELHSPRDAFVAPEGYYMLFLVSKGGVPSEAEFIRLER